MIIPRFLTVFISVIPYQTAAYVMDAFFTDGARVIFQLALTVLSKNEEFLLNCADDGKKQLILNMNYPLASEASREISNLT